MKCIRSPDNFSNCVKPIFFYCKCSLFFVFRRRVLVSKPIVNPHRKVLVNKHTAQLTTHTLLHNISTHRNNNTLHNSHTFRSNNKVGVNLFLIIPFSISVSIAIPALVFLLTAVGPSSRITIRRSKQNHKN